MFYCLLTPYWGSDITLGVYRSFHNMHYVFLFLKHFSDSSTNEISYIPCICHQFSLLLFNKEPRVRASRILFCTSLLSNTSQEIFLNVLVLWNALIFLSFYYYLASLIHDHCLKEKIGKLYRYRYRQIQRDPGILST